MTKCPKATDQFHIASMSVHIMRVSPPVKNPPLIITNMSDKFEVTLPGNRVGIVTSILFKEDNNAIVSIEDQTSPNNEGNIPFYIDTSSPDVRVPKDFISDIDAANLAAYCRAAIDGARQVIMLRDLKDREARGELPAVTFEPPTA